MRQGRAHFRDRKCQPEIHDGDDDARHQHAAPAAGGKAEIPSGKMPGYDRADAE
ncbi:hypothetical protein D3C86_1101530 [compost metagenome]